MSRHVGRQRAGDTGERLLKLGGVKVETHGLVEIHAGERIKHVV